MKVTIFFRWTRVIKCSRSLSGLGEWDGVVWTLRVPIIHSLSAQSGRNGSTTSSGYCFQTMIQSSRWRHWQKGGLLRPVSNSTSIFKYYPVPRSSLTDEIITTESPHGTRTVHTYPFATLGPILSHVQPHFVVYNASQKLESIRGKESINITLALEAFYRLYDPLSDQVPYILAIRTVDRLFGTGLRWTEYKIHRTFLHPGRSSRRLQPL